QISQSASEAGRSLSVGATPLIAANVLPAAISEFSAKNPSLRIRPYDADRLTVVRMVEDGQLDLGLGMLFYKPATGIKCTPLFRFSLMLMCADDGSVRRRRSVRWVDLVGQTFIGLPA